MQGAFGDSSVCYLGLGANLGARAAALARAIGILGREPGIDIVRVSSVYETAPEGLTDQPPFLNMAIAVSSALQPASLLDVALRVETMMGRVRTVRWGPRVIDIDLLSCGAVQLASERLVLPHRLMTERQFVLCPLAEIAPELRLADGRLACEAADPRAAGIQKVGRLAQVVRDEGRTLT